MAGSRGCGCRYDDRSGADQRLGGGGDGSGTFSASFGASVVGAGAFGGAGLLGLSAFAVLTAALVLLIATATEGWVAALIVAVAYAAVAGGLALAGKRSVDQATPPIPEQTIESTKADIDETKRRAEVARG